MGILCAASTLLVSLSLWSYDARGGENWIGPVGSALAGVLATAFGVGAWLLPVELGLATLRLFQRRVTPIGVGRVAGTMVIVLVGCALVHLALHEVQVFGGHLAGGVLGEVLGEVLRSLLGLVGAFVVGTAVLLVTVVLRTPFSVIQAAQRVVTGAGALVARTGEGLRTAWAAWREAKELERLEHEEAERDAAPRIVEHDRTDPGSAPLILAGDDDEEGDDGIESEDPEEDGDMDAPLEHDEEPDEALADHHDVELLDEDEPVAPLPVRPARAPRASVERAPAERAPVERAPVERAPVERAPVERAPVERASPAQPAPSAKKSAHGPTIVAPQETAQKPPAAAPAPFDPSPSGFDLPPTDIYDAPPAQSIQIDEHTLRDNARQLTEKLEAYGVKGRVDEIHPGPVVTMYEFEPQSGTKISKIAGLSDDLAMALAAHKVRIVAPIPGKARVGFELPNKERQMVYLREILEDDRWHRLKAALPVAFGKDIAGQPVYGDLARMPHLLVAGATGAGKSVGLNVLLCSLLARRTPDEVRMLMIDPKVVELAVFDGIPHMLLPVVTDMKKAALALRWAVDEMERRYQLFADAGARNITTFNARVEKVQRGEMAADKLFRSRSDENATPRTLEKLPYVVVVVDEFADLMMVAAKDVEGAIARLAQKARAAGIHVILATQRPSVDVITGMIKANFPARIAFKVSQREDSKTILGRNGAEHLLGMGDMLMIPPGSSDLHRVHSAYVSEDEVKRLCDHLRDQGKPVYDEKILEPRDDDAGSDGPATESDDPMFDRAVACVAQAGYCSISHIQRQLGIGYNKAAKLVERMELEGVVGPPSGKAGGRREVLVQAL